MSVAFLMFALLIIGSILMIFAAVYLNTAKGNPRFTGWRRFLIGLGLELLGVACIYYALLGFI